jgi:hypothetical protein
MTHLELEAERVDLGLAIPFGGGSRIERNRQLHAAEEIEALVVKEAYRLEVSPDRANVDELETKTSRLGDGLPSQKGADSAIPVGGMNHDRLELGLLLFHEKTAEPYDLAVAFGNPEPGQVRMSEVSVELETGIGAPDGWIGVEVAVVLGESAPQLPAATEIAIGVVAYR